MAMRSVLGAGQGSEELRQAIMNTIPNVLTPNRKYAMNQLQLFENTLNRLMRGVPQVPLRGGNNAQPQTQQTPLTNSKGWKLHKDAKGNKAYVSPDGKQFEEVK